MTSRGARLLVAVPSPTDPPARLGEWLHAAGLELDVRSLQEGGELPADLADHDGLLVLGGPQSSLDDASACPELTGVRGLLERAVAEDVPVLAMCLGAQLLAQVTGGRVRVGAHGPEVGLALVAKRDAADGDPLFGPLPLSPDVVQWHHDEIVDLPPGATLLASGPLYAHQAFRVGRRAYGLQFHVEATSRMVRAWAGSDATGVAASSFDPAGHEARVAAAAEDLAAVWAPFAGRFADLVRAGAGPRP